MSFNGIRLGQEQYTWKQIDEMVTEDVEGIRDDLETSLADISSQLNEAKARFQCKVKPEKSDPEWFHRAKSARTHLSLSVQRINRVLKKRKAETGRSLCSHFMDVCREEIDPLLFSRFLEAAKNRVKDD